MCFFTPQKCYVCISAIRFNFSIPEIEDYSKYADDEDDDDEYLNEVEDAEGKL